MTSLFAHDDAVGTTRHGADDPIDAAARVCRWAASVVGLEEPPEQNIETALAAEGLPSTEENIAAVRAAVARQAAMPGMARDD